MKARIISGSLTPGDALDARGHIDAAGAGDANGFRDVVGIEPARDHERQLRDRDSPADCQSNTAPRPPGRVASLGARASNRMRSATAGIAGSGARSAAVSTGSTFMTGNPNFGLMSRSRAVVSLPCNCRMSGRSVSTMLSSVASSASTVSATLTARPLACLPSSRARLEARDAAATAERTRSPPCRRRPPARRRASRAWTGRRF